MTRALAWVAAVALSAAGESVAAPDGRAVWQTPQRAHVVDDCTGESAGSVHLQSRLGAGPDGRATWTTPRAANCEDSMSLLEWLSDFGLEFDTAERACLHSVSSLEALDAAIRKRANRARLRELLHDRLSAADASLIWLLDALGSELLGGGVLHHGVSRDWNRVWIDCVVRLSPPTRGPLLEFGDPSDQLDAEPAAASPSARLEAPAVNADTGSNEVSTDGPLSRSGRDASAGFTVEAIPAPMGASSSPFPPVGLPAAANAEDESSGNLFMVDDSVPVGFEFLDEPQTVFVDVYFNESLVTATTITVTDGEVVFDSPQEVVAGIDLVEDPEALVALLSQPLPGNADRVCFQPDDPLGCGRIEADPVAVIYDENELRLDLFLASALQAVQSDVARRFLEAPGSGHTSILSLNTVATALDGADDAIDGSARLLNGYGRGYLSTEADYTSRNERLRLREFKLTHFLDGHEVVVGTYGWQPGGGWTGIELIGAGFSTSYKTRIDLEQAFSTELLVFLDRRSIVQLVVDGRVFAGASYAAGNQVLDTRLLPDGTYPVEIRIFDGSSGDFRSETRLFTKSTRIPPRGETVFSATAGLPRRTDGDAALATHDTPVAGFSLARRLDDRSAFGLGMLQLGANGFLQGDYLFLGQKLSLQLAATVGEENTRALGSLASFTTRRGSFSASYDHVASDVDRTVDPVTAALYPANRRQWDISGSRQFGDTTWQIGARRRIGTDSDGSNEKLTEYRIAARRPVLRRGRMRGFVDTGLLGDSDGRQQLSLRFDLFYDQQTWSAHAGIDYLDDSTGLQNSGLNLDANRQFRSDSVDWTASTHARLSELSSAGARLSLEHPLYRASVSSDLVEETEGSVGINSVASASADLGVDRQGAALGGAEFTQAGVIVEVLGQPAGEPFDILVNGVRASSGTIGSRRFVSLQPFESYDIKLVPLNTLSNGIGSEVFEFTLYPGRVERIRVRARRQVLLIAALVDPAGEPVANAVVDIEGNPQVTDNVGLLQAEVAPGATLSVTTYEDLPCTFTVPDAPAGEDVLVPADALLCQ